LTGRQMLQQIKTTFLEVISDFKSCINRANYFISNSTKKQLDIFFAVFIIFLAIVIVISGNKDIFFLNILKIIFVCLITYLIYCISDYFWFLIKKNSIYKIALTLRNREYIDSLIKKTQVPNSNQDKLDPKQKIYLVTRFYNKEYKYHAKRYAIEIAILQYVLLFYFPSIFILNLLLFGAMYFYVFIYEHEASFHAIDDIQLLIGNIKRLHEINPKQCKEFIINNDHQEVKDLKKLYNAVIKA